MRLPPHQLGLIVSIGAMLGQLLLSFPGARAAERAGDGPVSAPPRDEIRRLFQTHCFSCHRGEDAEAEVDLAALSAVKTDKRRRLDKAGPAWKRVLDVLRSQAMPPAGEPRLKPKDRRRLSEWIEQLLAKPLAGGRRDPGEVVLRRLNRAEYNYTVLDLFRLPRRFVRNYDPADGPPQEPIRVSRQTALPIYLPLDDADYGFDNIGEVLTLPPFLMEKYITTAHDIVERTSGSAPEQLTGSSRAHDALSRGSWVFNKPPAGADPEEEAEKRLHKFLPLAFRHPVGEQQMRPYLKLFQQAYAEEADFVEALKLPVQAALISPHFLYRVEGSPDEPPGQVVRVSNHELASRLSYFLWSTMPDRELLRLAGEGRLHDEQVLEQQVHRMLADRRAMALTDHFATQWLQIDTVESAMPDPEQFPLFAEQRGHMLLNYMSDEARFLFEAVMFGDRSIFDFIDPGYAYLNERLAKHYGIYDPKFHPEKSSDRHFVRYELEDPRRGGVLTLAGVLTATSQSTRTSPVARGKWVLEAILGAPPPPPPDDVPDLESAAPEADDPSLREKLALHRQNEACASCHDSMDPYGLVLENYDPIGAWRPRENGQPIDAAVVLPSGERLSGPVDLKRYIVERRRDDFARCLTEQMLIYALGRPLGHHDTATVRRITEALRRDDDRFSTLILEIVKSYPFQYRRTREVTQ